MPRAKLSDVSLKQLEEAVDIKKQINQLQNRLNGILRGSSAPSAAAGSAAAPTVCPACRSHSISTTVRHPDEHTYWRCDGCGEIWNVSRREAAASRVHRWR